MILRSIFCCLALVAAGLAMQPLQAQNASRPPASAQPVPSQLELSKLIWNIMAAVDHANQSGNYSVLRDMAAPSFQSTNDPARLAQIFAGLRQSRVDLSNTLLLAPSYTAAPIIQNGVLRTQGYFGLRPTAINFDLYFRWIGGKWRLFGVSINQRSLGTIQPANSPPSVR